MRLRTTFLPIAGLILLLFSIAAQTPAAVGRDFNSQSFNSHTLVGPEFQTSLLPANTLLDRMILVLRPDPARQAALEGLLQAQSDPSSAAYRQWLTPQQFGARFGMDAGDLARVTSWLRLSGLTIDSVSEGRQTVLFSGTAAEVESAFHTTLHDADGAAAIAGDRNPNPLIPAALSAMVEGVASLGEFTHVPKDPAHSLGPQFTAPEGYHYLAPSDFATIYNVAPLYRQGYDGSGESIAVVARSNVRLDDLRQFRSMFKLPPRDPVVVLPHGDPGTGPTSTLAADGDLGDATLAVEWAGAVAPGATIYLVATGSTATTDGAFLSAQYIVDKSLAAILTMNYSVCEASLGSSLNSFFHRLWQQAAAEGITVLVSAGDSGAAGCDLPAASVARSGRAVNGICSPPDSTCIGGTEFHEGNDPSMYWAAGNNSADSSATGYIPEAAWNESLGTSVISGLYSVAGAGLWAGGGGASRIYPKPPWQSGPGVPADDKRDVPDIAFASAFHDGYLVRLNGETYVYNGTSLAVPSFAGMMALIVQSAGTRLGNINPALYSLAKGTYASSIFHDITVGDNNVPGVIGYDAAGGYDMTTGLGSVDAQALVSRWEGSSTPPVLTLSLSRPALSLLPGGSSMVAVSVTIDDGTSAKAAAALAFTTGGLPIGVLARYTRAGSGVLDTANTTLTLSASANALPGTYAVQISASSSGISGTVPLMLTVLPSRVFLLPTHSMRGSPQK